MLTPDQACAIIDYIEAMEERTNHNTIMEKLMGGDGYKEKELDDACKALGKIAGRTFSIF